MTPDQRFLYILGSVFILIVTVCAVLAIAWAMDQHQARMVKREEDKKKPIERMCKNCVYLSGIQGLLFCGHSMNRHRMTEASDLCPMFTPYTQWTERDVLNKHLFECYQQVRKGD